MNDNTRLWVKIIGAEAAVVAVIILGIGLLVAGASGADSNHSMARPAPVTVAMDDLRPDMAVNYQYAMEHLTEFAQIPCYCGCDNMLGHRNLADCYVTPSGAWDAHASGCAVCAQETDSAREGLDGGTDISAVAASIIDKYGPPPVGFASTSS